MQRFSSHLNGFATCEEVCKDAIPPPSMYRRKLPVVCPKPRRVGQWVVADIGKDLQSLPCGDRQTGGDLGNLDNSDELLEIFLKKDCYGDVEEKEETQPWGLLSSSPPYFIGSPPRRASNPLVHDPNFLQGKHSNNSLTQPPFPEHPYTTTSPLTTAITAHKFPSQSSSSGGYFSVATATAAGSVRRSSCLRSSDNFGSNTAMVRIEGFDFKGGCQCSISAFA